MALRQWMFTHDWMIKPMGQTEWIERRGLLVWIADVFNSIGAGLYLVSLLYDSFWGMFAAWLIIIFLKMFPHLVYLGKPWRFWRMLPPFTDAWKTSWITRGIFFTTLFIGFAFIQLAISLFLPETGWLTVFKVLAGITAFLTGIYSGFVMSYCRSVPFWNSALLPLVFLFAGIADGLALIMVIEPAHASVNVLAAESAGRILLTINAVIIGVYLWQATYTSKTAGYSAALLLSGKLSPLFWGGVVACGIAIPPVISFFSLFAANEALSPSVITAAAFHTVGAFSLKYVLLKAGVHSPLLPIKTSIFRFSEKGAK